MGSGVVGWEHGTLGAPVSGCSGSGQGSVWWMSLEYPQEAGDSRFSRLLDY